MQNKNKIINLINNGSIFIYPTDTIAGIGCIGNNKKSVERIYSIKGRDKNKPFSYAFPDIELVSKYAVVNDMAKKLFPLLPGALTLVLPLNPNSPPIYGITGKTIGIRIPAVPWLLKLLKEINIPLVTTSANISSQKPCSEFSQMDPKLMSSVDFVIAWDKLNNPPSTVVSLIDKPVVLREGYISSERIYEIIG